MLQVVGTSLNNDLHRLQSGNILALLFFFWFFSPVLLSVMIFFYASFVYSSKRKLLPWYYALVLSFSYGILIYNANQGGKDACDLMRYWEIYELNIGSVYGVYVTANILFDSITWLSANYITTEPRIIGFFWPTLSVFFYLAGCRNIAFYFFKDKPHLYMISVLCCVLFIPLHMVGEILKQVAACSLVFYSISLSVTHRKGSLFFAFCAILLHVSSTLLYFPLLFWKIKFVRKYQIMIFLFSVLIGVIGILNLLSAFTELPLFQLLGLSQKIANYIDFDEFGGSKRFYILLLFYAFQVFLLYLPLKKNSLQEAIIPLLILCCLLMNLRSNHNLARMINVIYPFSALALMFALASFRRRSNQLLIIWICSLVFSVANVRQYTANISYNYYLTFMDNDPYKILTTNLINCFNNGE